MDIILNIYVMSPHYLCQAPQTFIITIEIIIKSYGVDDLTVGVLLTTSIKLFMN